MSFFSLYICVSYACTLVGSFRWKDSSVVSISRSLSLALTQTLILVIEILCLSIFFAIFTSMALSMTVLSHSYRIANKFFKSDRRLLFFLVPIHSLNHTQTFIQKKHASDGTRGKKPSSRKDRKFSRKFNWNSDRYCICGGFRSKTIIFTFFPLSRSLSLSLVSILFYGFFRLVALCNRI